MNSKNYNDDAPYSWGIVSDNNYEVSTKGDKRFSALVAHLDGKTIEEIYQLDVKGYRAFGNNWKIGKGKPPFNYMTRDQLWQKYKELWERWAEENLDLMVELARNACEKTLTDKFAISEINQAHALADILNEMWPYLKDLI